MTIRPETFPLFLLGFSSMFPLVNPIGTSLIINSEFAGLSMAERKSYARTICFVSFALGVGALLVGSAFLKFMGVSIAATQMGGGIIISRMGLALLTAEHQTDSAVQSFRPVQERLMFPLAFPLTLGPGAISALIALSAHAHADTLSLTMEHAGVLASALLVVLIITYICLAYSQIVISHIGPSGSQILNRLMSFLLFCIGIQMLIGGLSHAFPKLFG